VQRFGGSAGVEALPGLRPSGPEVVDKYCGVNFGATAGFPVKPGGPATEERNPTGPQFKRNPRLLY
jgi:hypothetical protein